MKLFARAALGACVSFIALSASGAALAQEQDSVAPQESVDSKNSDETIIVTGSRIARPNYDTVEPVIVVGSQSIEDRGFTTLGQALSEQPAFGVPGASPVGAQSSFGPGQNFVDFFSLGSQRTLTLVNGRRFVGSNTSSIFGPTGSGGSQVDLNIIPTKLIDRVETIAVGGAPIYGSDAIAGTVNVIMKRDYEGFEIDGQYGLSSRGDAEEYRVRGLAGFNFGDGRGNFVISGEYNKAGGLLYTDRKLTSSGDFFADTNDPADRYTRRIFRDRRIPSIAETGIPLVGSLLGFPITDTQAVNYFGYPEQVDGTVQIGGLDQKFDANGNLIPIMYGTPTGLPGDLNIDFSGGNGFSLIPLSNLLSKIERINALSMAEYQLTDNIRVFAEGWYSRSKGTNLRDQPEYNSGIFDADGAPAGNFIMSIDNPYLSDETRAAIIDSINNNPFSDQNFFGGSQDYFYLGRANTDLVSGQSVGKSEVIRGVLGLDGDFDFNGRSINWEVVGVYGRAKTKARNTALATQNLFNALDAVDEGVYNGGPANGNIICRPGHPESSAPTISSTCAPLNPFGLNQASQAARDYVTGIATPVALNQQWTVTASLAGPVASLPGGDLAFAVGYEHRYESQKFDPGAFFLGGPDNTPDVDENGDGDPTNDPSPYGQTVPIIGSYGNFNTDEVFGEMRADLVGPDQNIPLIHALEFKGAARYVDHNFSGADLTWTLGGRWKPVEDLTIRGNFTRAIRSPSITEAINPAQSYFGFATDPCDKNQVKNGPDPATRRANCIAAGIDPDTFGSLSAQRSFPGAVAGDSTLTAEKSNSWTIGALFQPTFLRRFNASVDYIDIKVKDVITDFTAGQVLSACYDSTDYPNNRFCDQIQRDDDGQLSFIQTGYANQAELRYKGILANVDYTFDTPFLGADSRMNLSVNYQYLDTLSNRAGAGAATNTAGEIGLSQHKALASLNYVNKDFGALISASYFGKAKYDVNEDPDFRTPNSVGDVVFINASMTFKVQDNFQLRFVVDNLFDARPPYPSPIGGGTITYFRGVLGRYFRVGATASF
ncbi:TonB-dependent receptor domain-containing protein [Sphingopyxis lindanitolerans]|nr:TonB-dependent receptor [Sphingopyxis lindanitolerans]